MNEFLNILQDVQHGAISLWDIPSLFVSILAHRSTPCNAD